MIELVEIRETAPVPLLRVATANAASGRDRRGRTGAAQWAAWAQAAAGLDVDVLAVQELPHSLGMLYEDIIEFLGFRRSSDE